MGLVVVLEDERGLPIASVEDPTDILVRVFPKPDDPAFHDLNRVDWYGDTTFNALQLVNVVREIRTLMEEGLDEPARALLGRILELAERCREGSHLYVKFYGD